MKKIVFLWVAVALMLGTCPVLAYELPSEFWPVNDRYAAALEAGDDWQIIDLASQSLAIIQNEPENEQTTSIRATRLEQMALAYARQELFAESASAFEQYLPYADKMGWADAVKIAKAKILQYKPQVSLFTPTDTPQRYYGARLEPEKGVYYGITSDSELRHSLPQASMTLLYLEFGDNYFDWIEHVLSTAQEEGRAVELAWNVPGQGSQIPEIVTQTAHIEQVLSILNKYQDVPVFIRFGAEVNIWPDKADPAQYIEAFRHIATLVHERTTNTAMVWSVNTVSSWDMAMEDYYPGDEYVDWIGVSLYMKPYFLGRNDWPENEKFNEVVFLSGDNADPVKALDEVMQKYGDRKPVMLAESGASHRSRTLWEDTTWFAVDHLRQLYYNVPMVYPQVKLIAYFDKVIESETDEYALSTSPALTEEYMRLVQLPHFIQRGGAAPVAYRNLADGVTVENGTLPVSAYVHLYRTDSVRVDYYIDGTWAGRSEQIPYSCTLDFNAFGPGTHEVTAVAEYSGGTKQTAYTATVVEQPIGLFVNGKQLETDTAPMLVNDRTFVPVRVVSEALGAEVGWDEATQTITLKKGTDTVSMQIQGQDLVKNGETVALDAAPFLSGDRTMVPVRAISEAFSASVEWRAETRSVLITL